MSYLISISFFSPFFGSGILCDLMQKKKKRKENVFLKHLVWGLFPLSVAVSVSMDSKKVAGKVDTFKEENKRFSKFVSSTETRIEIVCH